MTRTVTSAVLTILVLSLVGCSRQSEGRSNGGGANGWGTTIAPNDKAYSTYRAHLELSDLAMEKVPQLATTALCERFDLKEGPSEDQAWITKDDVGTKKVEPQPDGSWDAHGSIGTKHIQIHIDRVKATRTPLPWKAHARHESGEWVLSDFKLDMGTLTAADADPAG